LVSPKFVFLSINLIKQTFNKKNTLITPNFCSSFLISMSTKYCLDKHMLEKTKCVASEQLEFFKKKRILLVQRFSLLKIENVDITVGNEQYLYDDLDNIISIIINKLTGENRIEVKRTLDNMKEDDTLKADLLKVLHKKIKKCSKDKDIKLPNFDGLDDFLKENKGIFKSDKKLLGKDTNCFTTINKATLVNEMA